MEHISTEVTIADSLIKGLVPKLFNEHVANMGVLSSLVFFFLLMLLVRANVITAFILTIEFFRVISLY